MSVNKPIFTITCGRLVERKFKITRDRSFTGKPLLKKLVIEKPEIEFSYRLFGYYHDFDVAEKAVLGNYGDIHECNNDIACIEETYQGVYNCHNRKQTFYLWKGDEDTGSYVKINGWPKDLDVYYEKNKIVKCIGAIG